MSWLAFWVLTSSAVAIWASDRGRSGLAWFAISMLLSPAFGFLCQALLPEPPVDAASETPST